MFTGADSVLTLMAITYRRPVSAILAAKAQVYVDDIVILLRRLGEKEISSDLQKVTKGADY